MFSDSRQIEFLGSSVAWLVIVSPRPEAENASRLDELRAVIRDDRQLRVRFDELYDDELRREA